MGKWFIAHSAIFLIAMSGISPVHGAGPTTPKLAKTFRTLVAEAEAKTPTEEQAEGEATRTSTWKQATFGNGCFWCTEAVFEELHGVRNVRSGYTGGKVPNPTYRQVSTGFTGHAEVIHLEYNPATISFAKLLEVFWRTHDPTTLNRQGPDYGTQYRSAVFYHDDEQGQLAAHFKRELNKAHAYRKPIVTEITKASKFYTAERYHQDYFALHGRAPYCRQQIKPKLSKFRRVFADDLARNKKNRKPKADTPAKSPAPTLEEAEE